jgi:flagellar basal body-associated protein FliL
LNVDLWWLIPGVFFSIERFSQPASPSKGPIITVVVIICVVIAVVYAIYYFHKKQDDEVAARQASEFNHVPLVDDNL